jgi:hypothetical protein
MSDNYIYTPVMQEDNMSLYCRAKIERISPQIEEGHGFHVVDDGVSVELDSVDLYILDGRKPISIKDKLDAKQISYLENLIKNDL